MAKEFKDLNEVGNYIKSIAKGGRWKYYGEAVKHAQELSVHFNGEIPNDILDDTRPNEPKEIKEYRKRIFQPITKSKAKKVWNVIQRITGSRTYSVSFPTEVPTLLKNEKYDESLEAYLKEKYPYFSDFFIWAFTVALKQSLTDPNAIIAYKPNNLKKSDDGQYIVDDTQFLQPFGIIYQSKQVVDQEQDEYYTVLLEEKSPVIEAQTTVLKGKIFNIYTRNEIIEAKQIGKLSDEQYQLTVIYTHNLGFCPVITLAGEYKDNTFPFLYESYVSGVLPFWNKALRLDSDVDANYISHLYLERVEIQVECDAAGCGQNGAPQGHVCSNDKTYKCERCAGTGFISGRSPYGVTSVKRDQISGNEPTFPGVAYIDKPTNIVEIAEKKLAQLIDQGYEAVCMDILKNVGTDQSGVAKTVDRTDLDSFLMTISDNLFGNIISNSLFIISAMRYTPIQGIDYKEQLPTVNKPTHFDVLSSSQIIAEIGQFPQLPNQLKDVLLMDAIDKKFPNDYFEREYNKAVIKLDPLRGKSTDDKFTAQTNGWITKEDAIISENISNFILDAYEENDQFFELTRDEQYTILEAMAAEETQEIKDEKADVIPLVDNNGNNQTEG